MSFNINQKLIFSYNYTTTGQDEFSKYFTSILDVGIYTGLSVSYFNNNLYVSDGVVVVKISNNISHKIQLKVSGNISPVPDNREYLVLDSSIPGNVKLELRDSLDVISTDIILCKINYSNGIISGLDYSYRQYGSSKRWNKFWSNLAVKSHSKMGMMVDILISTTSELFSTMSINPAPPSNSRIDLVYVDIESGKFKYAAGTPAISPTPPSYMGRIPLAEITVKSGVVNVYDRDIKNVGAFLTGGDEEQELVDHNDLLNKGTYKHMDLDNFILSKGMPNGLASLESDGKVPVNQLRPVTSTNSVVIDYEYNVAVSINDAVYLKDNKIYKNTNNLEESPTIGIVISKGLTTAGVLVNGNYVYSGLVKNKYVYVGTDGRLTTTIPTIGFLQIIGYCYNDNNMLVNPNYLKMYLD